MPSKTKVKVYIHGTEYTIVGVETEQYIRKVASYVDKKMNKVNSLNNSLSTSMIAVLTAINVADDYFKCQEDLEQLKKKVSRHSQLLAQTSSELEKQKKENDELKSIIQQLKLDLVRKEMELNEFIATFDNPLRKKTRDNTVKIDTA